MHRESIRRAVSRATRNDALQGTIQGIMTLSMKQIPTYDFYVQLMKAQGKEPVSEEEFREVSRINYGTSARRHRPHHYSKSLDRLERALESESVCGNVEGLRTQQFRRGDKVMLLGAQIPAVQEVTGYDERGHLIFKGGGTGRAQRYRKVSEEERQSIIRDRLDEIRQKRIVEGGYVVHRQAEPRRRRAEKVLGIDEEGYLLLKDGKRAEPQFYLHAEFKTEGGKRKLKVYGEQRSRRSGRHSRR